MTALRPLSLGLATLTTGLAAGFFYTYTCSVTLGTARLDDVGYIATMQAINATVRNPLFAVGFFGALVSLAAATVIHLRAGWTPRAALVLLACLAYALGTFALTFAVSVPLNEELARVSLAASPEALAQARQDYEGIWNTWNELRTLFGTAAFALLIAAPFARAERMVTVAGVRRHTGATLAADSA